MGVIMRGLSRYTRAFLSIHHDRLNSLSCAYPSHPSRLRPVPVSKDHERSLKVVGKKLLQCSIVPSEPLQYPFFHSPNPIYNITAAARLKINAPSETVRTAALPVNWAGGGEVEDGPEPDSDEDGCSSPETIVKFPQLRRVLFLL
jgi:hypothetical protein